MMQVSLQVVVYFFSLLRSVRLIVISSSLCSGSITFYLKRAAAWLSFCCLMWIPLSKMWCPRDGHGCLLIMRNTCWHSYAPAVLDRWWDCVGPCHQYRDGPSTAVRRNVLGLNFRHRFNHVSARKLANKEDHYQRKNRIYVQQRPL